MCGRLAPAEKARASGRRRFQAQRPGVGRSGSASEEPGRFRFRFRESEMPVKRSLKLDILLQENSPPKSRRTQGHLIASYSPTTGTRQISPYSSPKSQNGQDSGNGPSNGQMELDQAHTVPRRGQPQTEDKDDIMILFNKIDKSLEKFTETWQSLKHLQALMGQPELENLIGVSCTSLDLKSEVQKTRELMIKVRNQEQLKKKKLKHFPRGLGHLNSYEFLKSIIN